MEITYVTTVGLVTILIRTQKGIEIITEVTALQERYESTLDELEANCKTLTDKVASYLKELE